MERIQLGKSAKCSLTFRSEEGHVRLINLKFEERK